MNHDEILENRAQPEDGECAQEGCELVFAMRDRHHAFSLDLSTVLQCLRMAEQEGGVPKLPDDWWIAVERRYKILSSYV